MDHSKIPETVYIKVPLLIKTQQLPNWFDRMGRRQAEDYVLEMYKHPKYSDGVVKTSQRSTFVIPDRFIDFLKHRADSQFE